MQLYYASAKQLGGSWRTASFKKLDKAVFTKRYVNLDHGGNVQARAPSLSFPARSGPAQWPRTCSRVPQAQGTSACGC